MSDKPVVALALSQAMFDAVLPAEDVARLKELGTVLGPVERPTVPTIKPLLRDAQVAITCWGSPRFDEELLNAAPKLRLIAHAAGSVKPIVTDAVYDRGIRVTTSAAANAIHVAHTTLAMMIVMLKRIPWLIASRGDKSIVRQIGPVREMCDLDVGIISASRVGREVIRLLKAFPDLRVRVYDPHLSETDARALGVTKSSLQDVLRCDVVSIHAPNLPQTRHMLNATTLALLPDHAVLINTSRGALIVEPALLAELDRRPLYVYLDVTDPEPPVPDSPITRHPNVILTPHIAGVIGQGRRDLGRLAIDQVLRFLRNQPLQHEVTREMLPTQA